MSKCNMFRCSRELKEIYSIASKCGDYVILYVCTNPACPQYSLIQVPVEDMPKVEAEKSNTED